MKAFNALDYTRGALAEEWSLIERHARDGSAIDAACACIQEKHLLNVAGLASEGVTLAKDKKEKDFYMGLANLARELRKNIVYANWKLPGSNPGRKYLPFHLTECEKANPIVQKRLSSCIKQAEKKTGAYVTFNPVAVCRASIKCPT